jgi:hypothetical protein
MGFNLYHLGSTKKKDSKKYILKTKMANIC